MSRRDRLADLAQGMAGNLGLLRARDILFFANQSTIARAQISPMVASARRLGLPNTLWTLNRLDGPEPWLRPRHRARVAFIQVEWDVRGETLAPFIDRLREHHPGIKVVRHSSQSPRLATTRQRRHRSVWIDVSP